jgi:DNA-binding response OmpR family regulator
MAEARRDVLVIEDDAEINTLVCAYVALAGFERRGVLTGNDGIREARQRTPSLVVLDLMLPDLDGFEVYRLLRSQESTRSVPVVILTAMHEQETRKRAEAVGVAAYLTKPFDPDQLIDAIRTHASA